MEFCGKTNVPIDSLIKIAKNLGNECDNEFLNLTGRATHPFSKGCRKEGWIGVVFFENTLYGNRFNFHIEEIEIL
jgi:hypothetical protein